jgi:hypothetical protein
MLTIAACRERCERLPPHELLDRRQNRQGSHPLAVAPAHSAPTERSDCTASRVNRC